MVEAEPGVGELELPDDEFGNLLLPRFAADATGLHRVGFDLSVWMPSPVKGVASPSHAIKVHNDQFNIIAFDNQVKTFRSKMVEATRSNLDQARGFLEAIEAGGGTELAKALTEAVKLLRGDDGDVFVITDGQVHGTEDILRLAKGTETRIHCLGIGSASQDRFLTLLARESSLRIIRPQSWPTTGAKFFLRSSLSWKAVDHYLATGSPRRRRFWKSGHRRAVSCGNGFKTSLRRMPTPKSPRC